MRRFNRRVSIAEALAGHDERIDDEGRTIVGSEKTVCPWCGETAEATIGSDNKFIFWHAPTHCCDKRRAITSEATRNHDREMQRLERQRRDYVLRKGIGAE